MPPRMKKPRPSSMVNRSNRVKTCRTRICLSPPTPFFPGNGRSMPAGRGKGRKVGGKEQGPAPSGPEAGVCRLRGEGRRERSAERGRVLAPSGLERCLPSAGRGRRPVEGFSPAQRKGVKAWGPPSAGRGGGTGRRGRAGQGSSLPGRTTTLPSTWRFSWRWRSLRFSTLSNTMERS